MNDRRVTAEQIEHLLKCLQAEVTLSEQLFDLGKQQQSALTNHMDEGLKDVTAAQDTKLRQLAAVRKRSEAVVKQLAQEAGISSESVTLLGLASAVDEPYASSIKQMIDRLVECAAALYQQNLINRSLLVNAVQYVSFCLRLLSGTEEKVQYSKGQTPIVRPRSLVLDQMV